MNANSQMSAAFQDEIANSVPSDISVSSIEPRRVQVRVDQLRSAWASKLEERFEELTSLPRGWDGYSAHPVAFTCAFFAANLLERLYVAGVDMPQLVPGSDGTLQIEWHQNQYDIEIDVLAPYRVIASRFDHRSGEDEELELQADFTPLADWISDLGRDRSAERQVGA